MKILITTDVYKPLINGVVTAVEQMEKQLKDQGHEVRIITLSMTHQSSKNKNIYFIKSRPFHIYPEMRVAFFMDQEYIDEIVKWKPDIIHTQCEFSTFRFARKVSKKLNIPIVHTYHTLYQYYVDYIIKFRKLGRWVETKATRYFLGKAETVVVPTEKVKDVLQEYNIRKPIKVIPTALINSDFAPVSDMELLNLKRKYKIPLNYKIMLTVGRLAKEKNIEELIQYFSVVIRKHPDITYVIAGDGPNKPDLEELAERLGLQENIKFIGMVSHDKINSIYQMADVFVGASVTETQGLTYYEAIMNKVPVICRNDQCLSSVVEDGETGLIYESRKQFMTNISNLLFDEDLYQKMKSECENYKYRNKLDDFAIKLETVYQQAIKHKASNKK